jgi:predicted GIY-YIG superfamily endonuclease
MPNQDRLGGPEQWLVYILRCADRSLYTGVTTDLDRRIGQHNAGTASRYTRSRLPVQLAYRETTSDRSSALRREAAIKRLSRRAKERLILGARKAPIPCGIPGG